MKRLFSCAVVLLLSANDLLGQTGKTGPMPNKKGMSLHQVLEGQLRGMEVLNESLSTIEASVVKMLGRVEGIQKQQAATREELKTAMSEIYRIADELVNLSLKNKGLEIENKLLRERIEQLEIESRTRPNSFQLTDQESLDYLNRLQMISNRKTALK